MMAITALGAMAIAACNKPTEEPTPQKPVVTAEMYSVTANSESGEVTFKFTATDLNPYWTVTDPKGTKTTFTDREVTKTYEVNGEYKGSIAAFGQSGQSDPVEFTFSIARVIDPALSETENTLMAQSWKPYQYGYCADETTDWWDWLAGPAPEMSADDVFTFAKDGKFILDLGANKDIFYDSREPMNNVTITGNEKWGYVKEGDKEFIQFSEGGFPSMLADNGGINGKYEIRNLSDDGYTLYYHQEASAQYFYIIVVPSNYVEPALTEEKAVEALAGKTFYPSSYGWFGPDWEWFTDVEAQCADDTITFNADGSLVLDLGETPQIYNDGQDGGAMDWTVTGNETWAVQTAEDGSIVVKFDNGGFPLMLAGAHVDASDPDFTLGLNGSWTISNIDEDGTVRLDIFQHFHETQWMTVFLSPVE